MNRNQVVKGLFVFGLLAVAGNAFAGGAAAGPMAFLSDKFQPIVDFIEKDLAAWAALAAIVFGGIGVGLFKGQGGSGFLKTILLAFFGAAVAVNGKTIAAALGATAALIP